MTPLAHIEREADDQRDLRRRKSTHPR